MRLNPYLFFDGTCAEAFAFYAATLGGKVLMSTTVGESPMAGHLPAEQHHKILHARVAIGDQVLMGSDSTMEAAERAGGFTVTLTVDEPAEAERVFAALAEGGTVRMPLQETFWAHRFGTVADRFGTPWMVNCERTPAGSGA